MDKKDSIPLLPEQAAQLTQPKATEHLPEQYQWHIHLDGEHQTRHFHHAMGLTIGVRWDMAPTVSERMLRGQLLIEEVFETLEAMGLHLTIKSQQGYLIEVDEYDDVSVIHVEGSRYCPIETADGLADIKVIVNGTAVSFGIPLMMVDNEVFASNMTKLDKHGKPVVNDGKIDPSKPIGKLLKSEQYVPANIARLYAEHILKEG